MMMQQNKYELFISGSCLIGCCRPTITPSAFMILHRLRGCGERQGFWIYFQSWTINLVIVVCHSTSLYFLILSVLMAIFQVNLG